MSSLLIGNLLIRSLLEYFKSLKVSFPFLIECFLLHFRFDIVPGQKILMGQKLGAL